MAKRKTYFEQVPLETVKKIAKLDFPATEQDDTRSVKDKGLSERRASGKKLVSVRAAKL